MWINARERGQDSVRQSLILSLSLVILIALLFIPYLGHTPLIQEEPRRAIVSQNMMNSGNYFVPVLDNRIYTAKPPLFNWLVVATSLPEGEITEFTARLPSVICLALLSVIMVWGMRGYLSFEGRMFLALAIILSVELMSKAQLAEIEMVFTFLTTLSLWSWFWLNSKPQKGISQWLLPLFLVALAFMAKGPPVFAFFYLSVVPFLLIKKRGRELFSLSHFIGIAVMSLTVSAWIMMMIKSTGMEVLMDTLKKEVLYRGGSGTAGDYIKHIGLYPLEIFAAMLPFSFLLIPLFFRSSRKLLQERHGDIYIFSMIALLANLPVYWIKSNASVRYFLPMFPTILVLAAMMYDVYRSRSSELEPAISRGLNRFTGIMAIVLIIVSLGLAVSPLIFLWEKAPPQTVPWYAVSGLGIAALAGAFFIYKGAKLNPGKFLLPALAGMMIVGRLIYFCDVLPFKAEKLRRIRNAPALMEVIERGRGNSTRPVNVVGWVPYDIWFYDKKGLLTHYRGTDNKGPEYFIGYENGLRGLESYVVLQRIFYKHDTLLFGKFNN